jgi:hypothetical protein
VTCDISLGSLTLSAPEAGDFVDLILLYQHILPPDIEVCLDREQEDAATFYEGMFMMMMMFHGTKRSRMLSTRHVD